MQVSFNGINNLRIAKKTYNEQGLYLSPSNRLKKGDMNYTELKISCDLTDDENGNDLSQYKKALAKCRPCYQINCINSKKPEHLDLYMKRYDVNENGKNVSHSNFKINNYDIMLDEKQILPMYDFLARFSNKIVEMPRSSEAQKYYAELVNRSIFEEVSEFINNY